MTQPLTDNEIVMLREMMRETSTPILEYTRASCIVDFSEAASEARRQYQVSSDGFASAIFAAMPITDEAGISGLVEKINMSISIIMRAQLDLLPWDVFFEQLEHYIVGFETEDGREHPLTDGEFYRSIAHALGFLVRDPESGRIRPAGSRASAMHIISSLQGLAYNAAYLGMCTRAPKFQREDDSTSNGGPYPWSTP